MGKNKRLISAAIALALMSTGVIYAQGESTTSKTDTNIEANKDDNDVVEVIEFDNNQDSTDDEVVEEKNVESKVIDVYLSSYTGKTLESTISDLEKLGLSYQIEKIYKKEPSEYVVSQYPVSGQYVKSDSIVYIYIEEAFTKDKVKWLQESLKVAGFYTAKDGLYGKGTAGKLKDYKTSNPALPNDTVFDTTTERELMTVLDEKIAPDFGTNKVLVNKNYYLPSDFAPKSIVKADVKSFKDIMVSEEIKAPLEKMFSDAKKAGHTLYLLSGYRSYDYQEMLFSRKVKAVGFAKAETVVAVPGESEHQSGLAVDVSCQSIQFQLNNRLEDTKEYQWLVDNCYKYGFILRYPKDKSDITGYIYEPWHYRYIGDVDTAKYIMDNKMTYDEYVAKKAEEEKN